MTDSDDLRRLATVAEAIEEAGGELVNVDIRERQTGTSVFPFGSGPTESVLDLTVSAEDVPDDRDGDSLESALAVREKPAQEVAETDGGDEEDGWG